MTHMQQGLLSFLSQVIHAPENIFVLNDAAMGRLTALRRLGFVERCTTQAGDPAHRITQAGRDALAAQ